MNTALASREARAFRSSVAIVAVALSVALGLPLVRVLIAVLYGVRESRGTPAALAIAVAVFSAPMLWVVVRRALGSRAATATALVGLAGAAAGVQIVHPIAWWLAGLGVACALGSWTLLLHAARAGTASGGSTFAVAFMLGLALDASVHAAFRTWDASWQSTPAAVIVTLTLVAATVAAAWSCLRSPEPDDVEEASRHVMPVAALGPFLVLQTLFLHNVAFAGAASGSSAAVGAGAVLAGTAAAMAITLWGSRMNASTARAAAVVTIVALTSVLPAANRWVVLPALIVAGGLSGWLLSIALGQGGDDPRAGAHHDDAASHRGAWRTSVAVTVGTMTFLALVFLFQIHASQPLPISNRFLPPAAALMLGVAAFARLPAPRPATTWPRPLILAPVVFAVAIPLFLTVTTPDPPPPSALDGSLRIVSWNVHSAVDGQGQVVPDSFAAAIAAQRADVVVLQEVSRGWPIGGSLDLAAWLSARLEMPFVWAPAADAGFGNVILSRSPILESEVMPLPFGSGPQRRSLLRVVLDAGGSTIVVVATHLETGAGSDTREQQIATLLGAVARDERVVIAGDMNMQPADDDVARFLDAGFSSAQDEAGNGTASTARAPNFPGDRPDWIFGSPDLTFSGFTIVNSDLSDHRPLVVTVRW
ncbi:MAG: endonuclease/exonuclease/phosphatase family protein [Actinomycetota bacterium]|nr:endonuclease/exonuclease/phosphatase family protein [Actinomycetota bacterium]